MLGSSANLTNGKNIIENTVKESWSLQLRPKEWKIESMTFDVSIVLSIQQEFKTDYTREEL